MGYTSYTSILWKIISLYHKVILLFLKVQYAVLGIDRVSRYLRFCHSSQLTKEILRSFGATIGERNVRIGPYLYIHNAKTTNDYSNLVIGEDVYIGPEVMLDLSGKIIFHNHSSIGMRSEIFTHQHFVGTYSMLVETKVADVVFEEFSGANPLVTILAGVTIGKNAYITPGSVATQNILPFTLNRGNPATVVANLPRKTLQSYEVVYKRDILHWAEYQAHDFLSEEHGLKETSE